MHFEWDPAKARANQAKHAVSFEEAAAVFRGAWIRKPDTRRDYGEARFVALGQDSNGVVLNVVYTLRDNSVRIISAWKASKHEREAYSEAHPDRAL
ncbi:MAG: BrnT family toxin [Xanthobacteraceae bacterium]